MIDSQGAADVPSECAQPRAWTDHSLDLNRARCCTMVRMTTESTAYAADLEAVKQVVATVEHSQQHKDPDEFLALFHPDAVWTTAHGKVLVGLDAISEFTRKVLPAADWDGEV